MEPIRGWPAVGVFVVIAVACLVIAVLYAVGALHLFAGSAHATHPRHAILFGGLGIVALLAASFLRPRLA